VSIHSWTVDGYQVGDSIPLSCAFPFMYDRYGKMALVNNIYLSRICVLSDLAGSVSSSVREIPEGINDTHIRA